MNEKLKFSWANIVAFIALIAVGYFSFMGFTYLTDGNFIFAGIGALLSVLIYVLIFTGAQAMKGSGNKISRKIVWERILIFSSPLVFVAVMIPISHFWTVKSQDKEISKKFTDALNNSRQLFSDYEDYSQKRISNYSLNIDKIIRDKSSKGDLYTLSGFKEGQESLQKENMILTLELMLHPKGYKELKDKALEWIGKAEEGTSTWNIFLLGNKHEIQKTVLDWEKQLNELSGAPLSNEGKIIPVEEFKSRGAELTVSGLDQLTTSFTTPGMPTLAAIFFGIVIYLMLLLPYFVQQRHGRQVAMNYSLFRNGRKEGTPIISALTSEVTVGENSREKSEPVERRGEATLHKIPDSASPSATTPDSRGRSQKERTLQPKNKGKFKRITLD